MPSMGPVARIKHDVTFRRNSPGGSTRLTTENYSVWSSSTDCGTGCEWSNCSLRLTCSNLRVFMSNNCGLCHGSCCIFISARSLQQSDLNVLMLIWLIDLLIDWLLLIYIFYVCIIHEKLSKWLRNASRVCSSSLPLFAAKVDLFLRSSKFKSRSHVRHSLSHTSRLAVDMKYYIHIHIHIHRCFVDIHGYIHIHKCPVSYTHLTLPTIYSV